MSPRAWNGFSPVGGLRLQMRFSEGDPDTDHLDDDEDDWEQGVLQ